MPQYQFYYLEYETQFTFIEEQIRKGSHVKKDKNKDHFYMTKETARHVLAPTRSNYKQREERRRELGVTHRELQALRDKKRAREGVDNEQAWTIKNENMANSMLVE